MAKKKTSFYQELSLRSELLRSQASIARYTTEMVQVMKRLKIRDKQMRKFVSELDQGGWGEVVIDKVIWDIGEELASQDPKVLKGYVEIQEWIFSIAESVAYYQTLLDRAEKIIPNSNKQ